MNTMTFPTSSSSRSLSSFGVAPPAQDINSIGDAYTLNGVLVVNGRKKATRAEHRLLISSIIAGLIVGGYGHCCTLGASKLLEHNWTASDSGVAGVLYAVVFCGAFQGIIVTGTDLCTSNFLYGMGWLMDFQTEEPFYLKLLHTLKQWIIVYVGNFAGCVLAAAMWTEACGYYHVDSVAWDYLCTVARGKVAHSWFETFVGGIGANFFVGLATLALNTVHDGIGTLMCVMLPVMAFCVGGFQHCIANMYTLYAADLLRCEGVDQATIWSDNLIPATLGCWVAGVLLAVGMMAVYSKNQLGFHYYEDLNFKKQVPESDVSNVSKICSTRCSSTYFSMQSGMDGGGVDAWKRISVLANDG